MKDASLVSVLFFDTQQGAVDCARQLRYAGLEFEIGGSPSEYGEVPPNLKDLYPLVMIFPTAELKAAFNQIVLASNPNLKQCPY